MFLETYSIASLFIVVLLLHRFPACHDLLVPKTGGWLTSSQVKVIHRKKSYPYRAQNNYLMIAWSVWATECISRAEWHDLQAIFPADNHYLRRGPFLGLFPGYATGANINRNASTMILKEHRFPRIDTRVVSETIAMVEYCVTYCLKDVHCSQWARHARCFSKQQKVTNINLSIWYWQLIRVTIRVTWLLGQTYLRCLAQHRDVPRRYAGLPFTLFLLLLCASLPIESWILIHPKNWTYYALLARQSPKSCSILSLLVSLQLPYTFLRTL